MRRFRRILVRLLLLALALYLGRGLWLDMLGRVFGIETTQYEQTDASFVYRLDDGKGKGDGLVFSFPPCDSLRLIVNGAVPEESKPAAGESFAYEVHYTLFDSDDKIIRQKIYHQSATKTHYRHRQTGREIPVSFLAETGNIPMDGQVILLNFRGMEKQPRRIHIKPGALPAPLNAIYVRVYWQKNFPESRLNTRWRRTSRETQKRLARGNIYPVDLLTGQEKRQLAAKKWQVLAPRGVRGEDFQRTTLYTVKPEVIETTLVPVYPGDRWSAINPSLLYIGAGKRGLTPLPMAGGRFKFSMEKANSQETQLDAPANIRLTWFGPEPGEKETYAIDFPRHKTTIEWKKELKGGVLEISPPLDITVAAVQLQGPASAPQSSAMDITPEPVYLKTYLCGGQSSPEYRVFPVKGDGVPVRVDLRGVSGEGFPMNSERVVSCELLDAKRQTAAVKVLKFQPEESFYDRVVRDLFEITEKKTYYFQPDADVSFLRFKNTGAPVLVSLYNRPPGLLKQVRVPEDSFAFERRDKSLRDWFLLKPSNHTQLEQGQRTVLLRVQGRPPQWDPQLLSGHYQWQAMYPFKPVNARLRRIFSRRDSLTAIRDEARASVYQRIQPGETGHITLGPEIDTVKMIWYNPLNITSPFSVYLDGKWIWQTRIDHTRGRFSLPRLAPLQYHIKVETNKNIAVFISPADIKTQPLYRERLALILEPGEFRFLFTKEAKEERLNLRLFSPPGATAPCVLNVEFMGIRREKRPVVSQWTLARRSFTVKPAAGRGWPVLNTKDGQTDGGQSLFFPLGEDVSPGTYVVKANFKAPGGQSGGSADAYYLSVARLVPGKAKSTAGSASGQLPIRIKSVKNLNNRNGQFLVEKPEFKAHYYPATAIELSKAARLSALLLKGKWGYNASDLARELGYSLETARDNHSQSKQIAILRALPNSQRGWGLYFFRRSAPDVEPVMVQAPHGGSDLFTGEIGLSMFKDHPVTVLALNTSSRSQIDLAHSEDTLFQVLTKEFARVFPAGRILQVHGFASEKRTTGAGKNASIIISNGTRTPLSFLVTSADCLHKNGLGRVLLYPRDVKELGGTTNSQVRLLKKMDFKGFVHIEINYRLRRRLTTTPVLIHKLLHCLAGFNQKLQK